VQVTALARLGEAGADCVSRLPHQTTLWDAATGRGPALARAAFRTTVAGHRSASALFRGAHAQLASGLVASRLPASVVHARRRITPKPAKKKGATPAPAHWALGAWKRLLTHGPGTIGQTETVGQVDPLRWQVALIVKAWKRARPVASLQSTHDPPTVCALEGRMLRMVLHAARCPQRRATVWLQKKRERRVRTRVRHCQALADRWMRAICQAEFARRRFLQRACATAAR